MHPRVPFRLVPLLILMSTLTIWQAVRLLTSIAWRDTLGRYTPDPGPTYIGATGALWTVVGLFLLWSFWRGKRWTRRAILIAAGLYAIWIWTDRILMQAQLRANFPFDLLITFIFLFYTVVIVLDPHNQIYFEREIYERESQNPPSE